MKFEWDESKNEENIAKHGLFFEDAATVFDSPMLSWPDARFDYGEDRWVAIGMLGDAIIVIVYTYRSSEVVRVISLRGALTYERSHYKTFLQERFGASEEHDG